MEIKENAKDEKNKFILVKNVTTCTTIHISFTQGKKTTQSICEFIFIFMANIFLTHNRGIGKEKTISI